MKPRRSWLVDRGMWYLENQPERAMWWYNRVFMPLALCFERPLRWRDGFPGAEDTDTILLLCRKELSPACYAGSRSGWYACPVQEHDVWRSPG